MHKLLNKTWYAAICNHLLYVCQFIFTVIISSAKDIQAARRQRRTIRAQKVFIPLSREGHSSGGSTPNHYNRDDDEDRIVDNDNDDDDEADDHQRRIEFAPRLKNIRERIAETLGMKLTSKGLSVFFFVCVSWNDYLYSCLNREWLQSVR